MNPPPFADRDPQRQLAEAMRGTAMFADDPPAPGKRPSRRRSKASGMSPTARTLAECRRRGWTAEKTEFWQPSFAKLSVADAALAWAKHSSDANLRLLRAAVQKAERGGPGKSHDLFGFVDVVALTPGWILAIQATATQDQAARVAKIKTECHAEALAWLNAGGMIAVWGWHKYAEKVDGRNWRVTETNVEVEAADKPF